MAVKKCSKCNKIKDLSCFYKNGLKHRPDCKECKKKKVSKYRECNSEEIKAKKKHHYNKNKDEINKQRKNKYLANKDKINKVRRDKYKEKPDNHRRYSLKYYNKNKKELLPKMRISNKNHYENNKEYYSFKSAKRRAIKKQATPIWANLNKIMVLYEKAKWLEQITGLQYDVDHIVPLQGKEVCGLHIWQNLQILERSINKSKSNN